MAKVTLNTIVAGSGSVDALNANFAAIAAALERLLSRDGTSPNQMEADIDLNGHVLLNAGDSDDPSRLVSYEDMTEYVAARGSGVVVQQQERQVATASQTVFNLLTLSYVPGSYNIAVYVDGVRKFSPQDFTETSANVITFTSGLSIGQVVEFVTNEYLSTVTFPSHTHPWSQITNIPVYASRFPTWDEVTGKPTEFAPEDHVHDGADVTTGRLADARRGVFVQATQPASPAIGDVWFWS